VSIAFIINTHKNVNQIARLVAAIDGELSDKIVIISHDGREEELRVLEGLSGVDRVVRAIGGRASFGFVDALLGGLRWLERSGRAFDWVVVLSGQCYPVRPLQDMAGELAASPYDGIFYHFDASLPQEMPSHRFGWPKSRVETRYLFRHWNLLNDSSSALLRAAVTLPRRCLNLTSQFRIDTEFGLNFGRRAADPPFNDALRLYGGSAWLTMRRSAADALTRFVDDRPRVTNYFRYTLCPVPRRTEWVSSGVQSGRRAA